MAGDGAEYRDLGPTQLLTAVLDTTAANPVLAGGFMITADQSKLNFRAALTEVYQIAIDGPVGSSFALYRNTRLWNWVQQGWRNTYDPANPLVVRPGDNLFFYWNTAAGTPVPQATIWMRYDINLPENIQYTGDQR
jgi:hypothetical protein